MTELVIASRALFLPVIVPAIAICLTAAGLCRRYRNN